jgi:hypothetical protein
MLSLATVKPPRARRDAQGPEEIQRAKLIAEIRRSLTRHWGSHRKVVDVQIRNIDGSEVHGFVNLTSEATHENFLLDFQATISQRGALSSLWVDGKRFPISPAKGRGGGRLR